MDAQKTWWSTAIQEELAALCDIPATEVPAPTLQTPPKADMGDVAIPCFPYAKLARTAPPVIATKLVAALMAKPEVAQYGEAKAVGPYLNIFLNLEGSTADLLAEISRAGAAYGHNNSLAGQRIMVEFSSPNTNKPLHLGHLRNDSLGESVSRILQANGAEVRKVNLVNNRGMHICKSMLAYKLFGKGKTPASEGIKGDHFVGSFYVKFAQWAKEDATADKQVQEMLELWEQGDHETLELWNTMNSWTMQGIGETYKKTGISFDTIYYESDTYKHGKSEILQGLKEGHFFKKDDGSVWVDLSPINLDEKVLLRGNGTTLYMTQDVGTAMARHKDWPFDQLVYVVGSEQEYHFKVLFYILQLMGNPWAKNLYHLSYGMVNLPDGKMKSREGTVVDADDLMDELITIAKNEIIAKGRQDVVHDLDATAQAIALGALNYYLLQVTPSKDMVFNPKESISFQGNTGPYIQYTGARIASILRKAEAEGIAEIGERMYTETDEGESAKGASQTATTQSPTATPDASLLSLTQERELISLMQRYPELVAKAGAEHNPALLTSFLYDIAKLFSRYYHDNSILKAESPALITARVALVKAIALVIQSAMALVGVPYLAVM